MSHQISADKLSHPIFGKQLASSYGRGDSKKLMMMVRGFEISFEVIDHGKRIKITESRHEAIKEYNSV